MATTPVLYTTDSSYYSMIARLVLVEKQIAFEKKNVDIHVKLEQFAPDYAQLNPHLTIPTLVYDDTILTSSQDILFFVDQLNKIPALQPAESSALTRMSELIKLHYDIPIENFTFGKLLQKNPLMAKLVAKIFKKEMDTCKMYGEKYPTLKPIYQAKENVIAKRMIDFSKENLPVTFEQAKQRIIQFTDKLNENLNSTEWAASDSYSLSDIVSTCLLARIEFNKESSLYTSKPNLKLYYEKVKNRPSFQAADIWAHMRFSKVVSMLWNNLSLIFT